jgi:UDP-N-acetylmuramate: L-alanyl-gamma-D-glutamyl-meso-diaminopimelate ligase
MPLIFSGMVRKMHIHILGICGKLMSSLAIIAKQMGYFVTGSDQNLLREVYWQLTELDIPVYEGYEISNLNPVPDCVIIGNALSRGQSIIEHILNNNITYYSGPEWLSRFVLSKKWVLAVSGTHGKTTTTSMLAWILEKNGFEPGYLIGGKAKNFPTTAQYSYSKFFVIEADEYDTAFFDKRSKFIHYCARTLIINNLEFDHADIFKDLAAIQQQFSHLLRVLPENGLIVMPDNDDNINSILQQGCWTPTTTFGSLQSTWGFKNVSADCSEFEVTHQQEVVGKISWTLFGMHNIYNALAAIAAAYHIGISPNDSIEALNSFLGVARRLELKGIINGISVYDDFAHHPTAISATLSALRSRVLKQRIFVVLEFGSHTMRSGRHEVHLSGVFDSADQVYLLHPKNSDWDLQNVFAKKSNLVSIFKSSNEIIDELTKQCASGDHVLFMSNLSFENIQERFMERLRKF